MSVPVWETTRLVSDESGLTCRRMLHKPGGDLLGGHGSLGNGQCQHFDFVVGCRQPQSIALHEEGGGGDADALVAVDKGVALRPAVHQRCGFGAEIWIMVCAVGAAVGV